LGYGSASILLESFTTAINDKKAAFEEASNRIPDAVKTSFEKFANNNLALGDLTADAYSAITAPL